MIHRLLFIATSAILLLLSSCKEDPIAQSKVHFEKFNSYITNYTQSPVSRCGSIAVDLNFVVESDKVPPGLFEIIPPVGGHVKFSNDKRRVYIENPQIKHNVDYTVRFNIGQLTEMPLGMEAFSFPLRAEQQAFDLVMGPPVSQSMDLVTYSGKITFAVCEPQRQLVEQCLSAKQDGVTLPISWKNTRSNTFAEFTIANIKRGTSPSVVNLTLSMEPLQVDDRSTMQLAVPSQSDFSMLGVLNHNDNRLVEVSFTDPLDKAQRLDGLIEVEGRSISRYKIIDNRVQVYFDEINYGTYKLLVRPGVKNVAGYPLRDTYTKELFFGPPTPQVTIAERGNILPPSNKWELPVKIISAQGFRMRILKVYDNNIHRLYQENADVYAGQHGLENLGKIVLDTVYTFDFERPYVESFHALQLDRLVRQEPGALYKVLLTIPREQNAYPCTGEEIIASRDIYDRINFDKPWIRLSHNYDYYDEGNYFGYHQTSNTYYQEGSREGGDPCKGWFDNKMQDARLLMCTDVGVVAKYEPAEQRYLIYTSQISSAAPTSGATVRLYDYQGQEIQSAQSDSDGVAIVNVGNRTPYILQVRSGKNMTYLELQDAKALSLSTFQVDGKQWQEGKKVLFYGDRDVWRPGDTVYMTAMVFNPQQQLPSDLPVQLKLFDPTNKLVKSWVVKGHENGLYKCHFDTDNNALTGNWRLEMSLGGTIHRTTVRIETIKPNRLKMQMAFANEPVVYHDQALSAPITVKWMHGLPAKDVRTEVTMFQEVVTNPFGGDYNGYIFNDIGRQFQKEAGVVAGGATDADGIIDFDIPKSQSQQYPGMMLFNFELRSFEKGGSFSTDLKAIKYSPYDHYVGAKFPGGASGSELFIEEGEAIMLASVSEKGNRKSRKVNVTLDRVDHNWWYQFGTKGDYAALSSSTSEQEQSYTVTVGPEGKAITIDKFGRFLLTLKDVKSGHQVSRIIYSYSETNNNSSEEVGQLEVLPFYIKRTDYQVGDVMSFDLPPMPSGQFLVTVESGGSILKREIRPTSPSPSTVSINIEADMAPTAYIHIHLIQAWDTHLNDRPLRLFCVKPINVVDPMTKIDPTITMRDEVQTDEEFQIKVAENAGKPMSYTLAVVDEGLLDITQFRTPDPWLTFFGKEGLQVKTWDMYRNIFHRFLGEYTSLLAVGGDGVNTINPSSKARRFKPVVKFLGPFSIGAGEVGSHSLKISDYVGSVRTMVVATNGSAVGSAEKTVAVKKPLMLYTTLPRVLGPEEDIKVPVTVFSMDKSIQNVTAKITTDELVKVVGPTEQSVRFEREGEQDISFGISTTASIGVTTIQVEVSSGVHRFVETMDLDVRPSAAPQSKTVYDIVKATSTKDVTYQTIGMAGTRSGIVSVSRGINFSFAPHVDWLSRYPHGCLEQTISRILPQIVLYKTNLLDDLDEMKLRQQLMAAIQKLRFSQLPSGGFSYWPGGRDANEWGTNYALEFLLEAKAMGYQVPDDMIDRCIDFQYAAASNPVMQNGRNSQQSNDRNTIGLAYRLYVLAKAGKPNYSAMNRLRLLPQLHNTAKWLLAHAFTIIGEEELAEVVVKTATQSTETYKELGGTFGSSLRDQAIIARTLISTKQKIKAKKILDEIITTVNDNSRYLTTQERAQVLITMAHFVDDVATIEDSVSYSIRLSDKLFYESEVLADVPKTYALVDADLSDQVSISNQGGAELYTAITTTGQPLRDDSKADEQDLSMQVDYYDLQGVKVDPSKMKKGEDYKVTCTIVHPGLRGDYQNLALTAIFPSGWEIINQRMRSQSSFDQGDPVDYRDVRDDRVSLYFDLDKGKRKTFHFMINAAYEGKYWAPPVLCEAMYDATVTSKSKGFWTTVK